jgi:nicotinamide-nucleotide amidase
MEAEARLIMGEAVWGADDDTLAGSLGQLLQAGGFTLATMESCTGGLLASTITDVAGSSGYFRGGYVAYSAMMKVGLGVSLNLIQSQGVVSPEVATDMARAARDNTAADYGIGVTGVVGPAELEGKPPGTVHIAVHDGRTPRTTTNAIDLGRLATKRRAVTAALLLLRRVLLERA